MNQKNGRLSNKERSPAEPFVNVTLVFDGGSKGNPGPTYGSYWVTSKALAQKPVQRMVWGEGTNNEAEYRSLIQGLLGVLDSIRKEGSDPKQVSLLVRGDSKLVLNQMAGLWKTKSPRMRALHAEALSLIEQFGEIQFVHQERKESVRILGH